MTAGTELVGGSHDPLDYVIFHDYFSASPWACRR